MRVWLAELLWFLLVLLATLQLPRIWRGTTPALHTVPGWWLWGRQLWFGMRRLGPLAVALGWFVMALFWFPAIGKSPDALTDQELMVGIAAIGVLFAIGALMLSIVLFNRPAFIVPPKWRAEPGALREWFRPERKRVRR